MHLGGQSHANKIHSMKLQTMSVDRSFCRMQKFPRNLCFERNKVVCRSITTAHALIGALSFDRSGTLTSVVGSEV